MHAHITNQDFASLIKIQISSDWEALERTQTNSYNDYVDICNKADSVTLPPRVAFKTSVRHTNEANAARKVVISVQPETVSTAQTTLSNTYDETQENTTMTLSEHLTVASRLMLSIMPGSY